MRMLSNSIWKVSICSIENGLQVAKVFAAHWKDLQIPVLEEVSRGAK